MSNSIDRKFKFVAVNPSNGKHYTEDSGVVFCAHDKAFLEVLPLYIEACKNMGANELQIKGAEALLNRVRNYQETVFSKVPDINQQEDIDLKISI